MASEEQKLNFGLGHDPGPTTEKEVEHLYKEPDDTPEPELEEDVEEEEDEEYMDLPKD
jgi:hypothetical protein